MKTVSYIPVIFLFLSCTGNRTGERRSTSPAIEVSDSSHVFFNRSDSGFQIVPPGDYYLWEVNTEKRTLKKNTALPAADADVDSMINNINRQYEHIILEKTAIKQQTLEVKIVNRDFLDHALGPKGRDQYFAQSVINLTSIPGIKYVSFNFNDAGMKIRITLGREDFPGYIIIH